MSEPRDIYVFTLELDTLAYESYSNWLPSTTLGMHEKARVNIDWLWFACEVAIAPYFGFLHGA